MLETLPSWVLTLGVLAIVLFSLELGFRLSRRTQKSDGTGTVQAAMLGLVALLLAFSYGMGAQRLETRQQLVVKEANAIGTLYLRTGFFDEPVGGEMRARIRRYVDIRLEGFQAVGDPRRFERLKAESDQVQQALWSQLQATSVDASPQVLILATEALNEMIDVSSERLAAFRNRIPAPILLLLLAATMGASLLVGYSPESMRRGLLIWAIFAVMMTSVMFALFDLDRPRFGAIRTSQQALLDLQAQLASEP